MGVGTGASTSTFVDWLKSNKKIVAGGFGALLLVLWLSTPVPQPPTPASAPASSLAASDALSFAYRLPPTPAPASSPAAAPAAAATTPPQPRPDETAWSFVQMATDWRQVQAFIDRFPDSAERQKAEALRDMLRQKEASLTPAPSVGPSKRALTIGFSQIGHESDWRVAQSQDMQEEARSEGIDLKFSDANQKEEDQLKAVRSFIAQKVDAIVIAPIVVTGWDQALKEAKAANIPVFIVDRDVDVADKSLYVTRIASDFNLEGRLAGAWLAQASKGTCNIVELQGTVGSAAAVYRKEGFEAAISQFPRMKIVKSQSGDFTTAGGKSVMESFIKATNNLSGICAVFAHNDNMQLGAIQAMKEAGLRPGKDFLMVSIDYIPDIKKALAVGDANASVELTSAIGKYVYPVVTEYLNGKRELPKWTVIPDPVHTAESSGAPSQPTAAAAPSPAATAAAAATPPQPAASPGVAVSPRAAMLVAVAGDPQKPPAISLGSVVWTSIPAAPGQPATVGVKAEADIPTLEMHAVMTIRKNTDPTLPASHTIDLRMTFADGAEIKGVKDMRVPMMRRDNPPGQDPLAGVRVKISDSYFLVGLWRADADAAHNVDLIASRGWFDFPLLLNDDRIAKPDLNSKRVFALATC